jgi:predicted ATP-grasp superfamily ATP-dependent carboligase
VDHDVLIFGASTRAAAFSAVRCGLRPQCVDYFADRDLAAICPVARINPDDAASQFAAFADTHPPSAWFYTGGFENHPEWVDRIAHRHRLWGVDADLLRAVRDPMRVAEVLDQAGLPCPAVRLDSRDLPCDGSWLVKPLNSGGGRGIAPLTDPNEGGLPSHYLQQRIDGPSFSALFVGDRLAAHLVGVTRQWVGIAGFPFLYRGSIGPWLIDATLASRLRLLGDRLASAFELVGWFGVDYVLYNGHPWPVEINPRYTASLEIHELASGRSLLAMHRRACEGNLDQGDGPADTDFPPPRIIAKLTLYAQQRLIAPEIVADDNEPDGPFAVKSIADVPWSGTCFACGDPVMTILAEGADLTACQARLGRLERKWRRRLGFVSDGPSTTGL